MRRVILGLVIWGLWIGSAQAANAIFYAIDSVGNREGNALELSIRVTYSGSDVTNGLLDASFSVVVDSSDSPVAIRQKISDAIAAEATRLGIALARSDIVLLEFQKGI